MTPELFAIGGGVVLLILAALGGGIEAKEVKVPRLPPTSRGLCAIAGVALVITGVYLKTAQSPLHLTGDPPQTKASQALPSSSATSPPRQVPDEPKILPPTPVNPPQQRAEQVPPGIPSIEKAMDIRFTVQDRLGPMQISEHIEVYIEGKRLGILTIDEARPTSVIEAVVSTPGDYQYRLSGQLRERDDSGERVLSLTGSGKVHIERGTSFFVRLSNKLTSSAVISLVNEP